MPKSCLLMIMLLLATVFPSTVSAQAPLGNLFGTDIDLNDPKYRDVADAIVLFQRGNGAASLNLLQQAASKQKDLPPGGVMFAHLCFANGNVKLGREILQVAAVESASDPEVWNMLADLQMREGHLAEAALVFEKAITVAREYTGNDRRRTQQMSNAYAGAALAYERRNLWTQAESHLQDWKEMKPETMEVYPRLAAALINTGRFDEAMAVLEELRAQDSEQLPAQITLGLTYERLGKQTEARTAMLAGLKEHPEEFATQLAVARWALGIGDLNLARECAAQAASLNADSPLPDLILGQADYQAGNFEEAEETFQKIYQSRPSNFDATNGLALAILAQDDEAKYKLALEYAELLAKSNNDLRQPSGAQAAGLLAWALHRNGKTESSIQLMAKLANTSDISAENCYFAGVIFAQANRKDIAREFLTRAVESKSKFPFHQEAAELLETLK